MEEAEDSRRLLLELAFTPPAAGLGATRAPLRALPALELRPWEVPRCCCGGPTGRASGERARRSRALPLAPRPEPAAIEPEAREEAETDRPEPARTETDG
jgi:hypothetical protein